MAHAKVQSASVPQLTNLLEIGALARAIHAADNMKVAKLVNHLNTGKIQGW